jgi:heat shock protein HslJ
MSDELVREKLRLYADDVAPVQLPAFGGVTARRRRRRTQRLLSATSALVVVGLVVVLASVLGGGSSSPAAAGLGSELIGGKWSLSSITTAGSEWKAPAGNGFSLSFTASGYTGNDSCNSTSGTVSYGTATVHLRGGAMTDIGCLEGDQARMQDAFRLLLDKDLPASVSGGTLTITAGQTVFALTRLQPAAPVDLSKALPGTTWALISIEATDKDTASSTPIPANVYAEIAFRAKDYLASDGCNSHYGTASYASTTLSLGAGPQTAALCPEPTGVIGKAYDKILTRTLTPTLAGDSLTFSGPTGSLTFTRETPAWLEQRLTAFTLALQSVDGAAAPKGWTLKLTATSYRAASKCLAYNGSVSYANSVSLFSSTTEGTCAPTAADTQVGKVFARLGGGPVAVSFIGGQMTLTDHGTTLAFAPGEATSTAVPASPVASAPPTGIFGMKAALIASPWKLETLKTPTDSWHAIATSTAGLTFTDEGYQASDGCDSEGTAVVYDESAATVDFTRGGETSAGVCDFAAPGPPKGSLPPRAYFDALLGPVHVALSGDSLTLTRTGVVLTFSKQVAATASAPPVTSVKTLLAGSPWRLVSVDAPGTYWRAIPGSTASLRFETSAFSASDGCSSMRSGLTYDEAGGLTLGGGESAMAACSMAPPGPPQGTLAPTLFFSSLAGEAKVTLDGDVLSLTLGTTVLTLTRGTADYVDPQAGDTLQALLTGGSWTLHRIVQPDKIWGDPQQVVLRFGPHGYIINPDCNDHLGAISYTGGRLIMRFSQQTAMGCPAAEKVQERSAVVVDALFSGPVSVEEDAGLLILWNSSTSLELHQGSAPKHDVGVNLPPASAAPPTSGGS